MKPLADAAIIIGGLLALVGFALIWFGLAPPWLGDTFKVAGVASFTIAYASLAYRKLRNR